LTRLAICTADVFIVSVESVLISDLSAKFVDFLTITVSVGAETSDLTSFLFAVVMISVGSKAPSRGRAMAENAISIDITPSKIKEKIFFMIFPLVKVKL